jgi:hypothetical protein
MSWPSSEWTHQSRFCLYLYLVALKLLAPENISPKNVKSSLKYIRIFIFLVNMHKMKIHKKFSLLLQYISIILHCNILINLRMEPIWYFYLQFSQISGLQSMHHYASNWFSFCQYQQPQLLYHHLRSHSHLLQSSSFYHCNI